MRTIDLSAECIQGSLNTTADLAFRECDFNQGWRLLPVIFRDICRIYGELTIDLFATWINTQLPLNYSWKPDPEALGTDVSSIHWNNVSFLYAFPPFRVIKDVIRKLSEEQASFLAILPVWRPQPWFAEALPLLRDVAHLLPHRSLYLP